MDIEALHDAIGASPTAKAMADAGNDAGAAAEIALTLPPRLRDVYVTELSILSILGPEDGDAALTSLEGASQAPGQSILARTVRILRGDRGINLGDPLTRGQLDALQAGGVLQPAWVSILKAAAELPAHVDYNDVSAAWARYRVTFRDEGLAQNQEGGQ